ncbi:MAG: flagellar motor switch phosphatase FliY [Spirochaetaceae bacterium]|jgi:flagellar motor switch protein FliN/FliY|nr:flagellar motor switch phosphatase FliY [Spirochaetaceae bacterium]
MSDGSLSQAEIDALLSSGKSSSSSGGSKAPEENADTRALEGFLSGTVDSLSSNLSVMTGGTVTFSSPKVSNKTRDGFINELPSMVTVVKVDFTSGFPGEHLFLMSEDTAKSIASLMNNEDNITLDEMAMSVIGEAVSQMTGTLITALTNKTGNKSIASGSPEAANIPKATAALPSNAFPVAAYQVNLGDGKDHKIWEIFGASVASGIADALNAPPPNKTGGNSGGNANNMSSQNYAGAQNTGNQNGHIIGGAMGSPSSMQSVQFPNLSNTMTPREQGNIGLLMDVYMEMTVELGRTRKLIKEILSMGEGTIIELDKLAGEPVDILVNNKLVAKGEVVVIDENFGVRVTTIVSPSERMPDLS